jgi:hypothetical protein
MFVRNVRKDITHEVNFATLDRVPRSGVRVTLDAGWASAGDDR